MTHRIPTPRAAAGLLLLALFAVGAACGGGSGVPALCGNGVVDDADGEACDDGINDGGYGSCAADCSAAAPTCGDGVIDAEYGEVCDDTVNDALGGGCLPGCLSEDRTRELFTGDLLEIAIDMPLADWDAMRHQRKTRHSIFGTADCRDREIENPYTYFAADVTIDGAPIAQIGVRKKGHLGSQSTLKPSMKLAFDEFVAGQRHLGAVGIALNNSKSDPSYARTCLSYATFTAAGLYAPRCTWAHVTVNGQDLGVYVVTEEMEKPFLARRFDDPSGNLYEGTACDFRPGFFGGFEQETNTGSDPDRDDLQAVYDIVQGAADDDFEPALAAVFDIDRLYRFWAVESLIWHRDGYSGNANNYFLYANPSAGGRFALLPWGPDSAFRPDNRANVPDSVLAFSAITERLYTHTPTQDRYYAELAAVLDQVWDPDAAIAEVDRIAGLLVDALPADEQATLPAVVADIQTTIAERRSVIEATIADGPPAWTAGLRTSPCRVPVAPISGTFSTTWDTLGVNIFTAGTATLNVVIAGQSYTVSRAGARAGVTGGGVDRVQITAEFTNSRKFTITTNLPDPKFFEPFLTVGNHELIGPPVTMNVSEHDISVSPQVLVDQFEIGEGTWTFDQVEPVAGAPITGSFQGTLYRRVP